MNLWQQSYKTPRTIKYNIEAVTFIGTREQQHDASSTWMDMHETEDEIMFGSDLLRVGDKGVGEDPRAEPAVVAASRHLHRASHRRRHCSLMPTMVAAFPQVH